MIPGTWRAVIDGIELEAQVDDVGLVLRGVADPARDLVGTALAVLVEHADGHDLRVVGEARDADAVVHALRDRAGDVRAVPELVVRAPVAVDEVVAAHEGRAAQVGSALEAPARLVGGARVDHRHDDTAGRRAPRAIRRGPRPQAR